MKRRILAVMMAAAVLFTAQAQGTKGGSGAGDGGSDSPSSGARGSAGEERASSARTDSGFDETEALRTMDRLRLQTQERDRIRDMLREQDGDLLRIRAELRELQARMTRLMLQERVDRPEIERTLRQSTELEFRMRMIQVERHIRIKEMLGAERWAAMYRLTQMAQAAERAGRLDEFLSGTGSPEQTRALLQILKGLF